MLHQQHLRAGRRCQRRGGAGWNCDGGQLKLFERRRVQANMLAGCGAMQHLRKPLQGAHVSKWKTPLGRYTEGLTAFQVL